jgi:hypothetical protein
MLTYSLPSKQLRLSTLSLDSIDKENDRFDLMLYDSLNDASSDDEQFYECSNEMLLIETIAHERQLIEHLTRRCSSLDSLDNDDYATKARRSKTIRMM